MGFLDRLFGNEPDRATPPVPQSARSGGRPTARPPSSEDEQALARYRYLLRTAPP